ncbi:MFS transporter [Streptococcus marmotae]|uniref:MFS transporter n=1 Tax=Streptococcus marmotae TaxID=1825069 RepID=UPI001F4706B1|nr:MFS transporter [Streptococcus marmotae]
MFHTVNTIVSALQLSIVPIALEYQDELIDKSIDIQYLAGNVLDIISNFVASVLLGIVSYQFVLKLSVPIFISGLFFIYKLNLMKTPVETEEEDGAYLASLSDTFRGFFSAKKTSFVILCEAFLSGATDLLLTLLPLYLILIDVDIKWLGLVLAVQKGADFCGAMIAPYIKMLPTNFFCIDYILSGLCLLGVFILNAPLIKLSLYFIAFVIIGISGNFFEKLVIHSYKPESLAGISSMIRTSYALFGILFMALPLVYQNIVVMGIAFNILTVLFGVVLLFWKFTKDY